MNSVQPDESNDQGNDGGVKPQIFYKKDDSKIMYEEGQETYRPHIYQQPPAVDAQDPRQAQSQIINNNGVNTSQGASLRRRTISP